MRIELEELCDKWLESWTGNNPQNLLLFYDENAYYQDPSNQKGYKGHVEIKPYFEKLLAQNPNWVWKRVEIFPTKNGFNLKWKASIPIGSKICVEYGMDIVELNENKITRNEVYFDRTHLLKLLKNRFQ